MSDAGVSLLTRKLVLMRVGQKRTIAARVGVLILLSLAWTNASAAALPELPPLYSIYGDVTDTIGRPLQGVRVTDDSGHSSDTNAEGRFTMQGTEFGSVRLLAVRNDLETRQDTFEVTLPLGTYRHDFSNMLFRFTSDLPRKYVSTASQSGQLTAYANSWAPGNGVPGLNGASCVRISDSRANVSRDMTWEQDSGSYSIWSIVIDIPQGTPEGQYSLKSWAYDCGGLTSLSFTPIKNYTVDNSAPIITDIVPRDPNQAGQPIRAHVADQGPSGIRLNGITFLLTDVTEGGSPVSYSANYNATSQLATSTETPAFIDGHDYLISVTAVDRAGNEHTFGPQSY
ncbi:MAG: hypothetical protein ABR507_03315 [Actinomycetota bacterium]